jgi:hypothetical protein
MKSQNNFKSNFDQLKLLLWKSFQNHKRSWIGTLVELIMPAFFALILLPIRATIKSEFISDDTVYKSFEIDDFHDDLLIHLNSTFGYYPNTSTLVNKIANKVSTDLRIRFACN